MRVAVYCRYSSEAQREGMSIEAQRRECQNFADSKEWKIVKFYIDEARSGTSDDRPQFLEMISDATKKNNPFDIVLVHKLDRFARNRYDSIKYKHLLRKKGIKIISATQPILGSGDPTEVILESVLEGMDEFYSLNLARESLKGMAENARAGYMNGGVAPFGFRAVSIDTPKGKKRKLEIDPSEAKTVKRIFKMYLSGIGVNAIRHRLNSEGVTLRGGKQLRKNTLLSMLRNEKYAGDSIFGKRLNRGGSSFDMKFEPITVKNSHEAIIERETWQRAQKLLSGRNPSNKHPRATASDYLFSGIIECGLCGYHFTGRTATGRGGRKYRYYTCGKVNHLGPKACPQKSFNADPLEAHICAQMRQKMTSKAYLKKLIKGHNETLKASKKDRSKDIQRIEKEIEKIDRKKNKLFEALEDDIGIGREDIAPRLKELSRLKTDHEFELEQMRARSEAKPVKSSADIVSAWVKFFSDLFSDESFFLQKSLVQRLILRIVVGEDDITVTFDPSLGQPFKMEAARLRRSGSPGRRLAPRDRRYANQARLISNLGILELIMPLIAQRSFSRPYRSSGRL